MSEQRWFCRNEQEWDAMAERLKQTPCPHCKAVGTLNRHGFLRGYDEGDSQRKTIRARRVFCSNRQRRRRGCGRTFSIWLADKIRRLSVTTHALWRFLQRAVASSIAAACRVVADCRRSDRTWQRVWKRFHLGQSKLRTALSACCPPPDQPAASRRPATHVVEHLQAAFPDANCPITDFQHSTQTFFV